MWEFGGGEQGESYFNCGSREKVWAEQEMGHRLGLLHLSPSSRPSPCSSLRTKEGRKSRCWRTQLTKGWLEQQGSYLPCPQGWLRAAEGTPWAQHSEWWWFADWCKDPEQGGGGRPRSNLELDWIGHSSLSAWTKCGLQWHGAVVGIPYKFAWPSWPGNAARTMDLYVQ